MQIYTNKKTTNATATTATTCEYKTKVKIAKILLKKNTTKLQTVS